MSSNRGRPWEQKFEFFGKIESAKEENDLHLVKSFHAYKVCGLTLYYLKIYQKKVRRRLVIWIMNCSVSINLRKGQKKKIYEYHWTENHMKTQHKRLMHHLITLVSGTSLHVLFISLTSRSQSQNCINTKGISPLCKKLPHG